MLLHNITKFLDNPYREDLLVKITFILSIFINIITWIALYFKLSPFSYLTEYGQIYLHYNIYYGVDSIGIWYQIFIIPIIGLVIILLNNILGYVFYLKEKIITYILLIAQTLIQIVLLAAAILIILLNI